MHSDTPPSAVSTENNTLLVRLSDSVQSLTSGVNDFIKNQREENQRIHTRIDQTAQTGAQQVGEIKEAIASRGRVSGRDVLSLLAVVISSVALLAGLGHSYVGMRLENITPRIDAIAERAKQTEVTVDRNREDLTQARIDAAFQAGQTSARFEGIPRREIAPPSSP